MATRTCKPRTILSAKGYLQFDKGQDYFVKTLGCDCKLTFMLKVEIFMCLSEVLYVHHCKV